jgi:MraZ protein
MGQNGITQRFRGSYSARIDDRGRLKIPARFLSVFETEYGRDVFITSLNGDHVILYPIRVWEEMESRIESHGAWDPDMDDFINRLGFFGVESAIDSKGRILLPPELRRESRLEEEVRVFGKASHLVIWNAEFFRERELGEQYSKEKLHRISRIINGIPPLPGHEQ